MFGFLKKEKENDSKEELEELVVNSNVESLMDASVDVHVASTASLKTGPGEQRKRMHPALSKQQCKALVKEFFEGRVAGHNFFTCFNKCSKLSE